MASLARRIPSADRNSVTTTSAPNDLHSRRNGDSETPAIGARYSGTVFATRNGKRHSGQPNGRRKIVQHQELTQLAGPHSFARRHNLHP